MKKKNYTECELKIDACTCPKCCTYDIRSKYDGHCRKCGYTKEKNHEANL